jgi:hypothetical protein
MPVWIMDAVYRGYIQQDNPNPDTSVYFQGEYESNYGIIYSKGSTDCLMTPVTQTNSLTANAINTLETGYVGTGHNFFNYQTTSGLTDYDTYDAEKIYSLGNYFFRSTEDGDRYPRMSYKEKAVMNSRVSDIADGQPGYDYSILKQDVYYIGQIGINFVDASGVMLNGNLFSPP